MVYTLISYFRFIHFRKKYEKAKRKSKLLITTTTAGVIAYFHSANLFLAVPVPCTFHTIVGASVLPLIAVFIPVGFIDSFLRYLYARIIMKSRLKEELNDAPSPLLNNGGSPASPAVSIVSNPRLEHSISVDLQIEMKGLMNNIRNPSNGESHLRQASSVSVDHHKLKQMHFTFKSLSDILADESKSTTKHKPKSVKMSDLHDGGYVISTKKLKMIKFLHSPIARSLLLFILLAPLGFLNFFFIAKLEYLQPEFKCSECPANQGQILYTMLYGAGFIAIGFVMWLFIRKIHDPLGLIFDTVFTTLIGGSLMLIGFLVSVLFPDSHSRPYFSFYWIMWISIMFIQYSTTDRVINACIKSSKQEQDIKLNNIDNNDNINNNSNEDGGNDDSKANQSLGGINESVKGNDQYSLAMLQQFLKNPINFLNFEEHLAGEFSVELLRMYRDCNDYKDNYPDLTDTTRIVRAKRIFDIYIRSGSVMEVNLSWILKEKLERQVKEFNLKSGNIPSINFFEDCQYEVLLMMRVCCLFFCFT